MNDTIKKWGGFVVVAVASYLALRILMILLTPQTYMLIDGTVTYHNNVNCDVIQTCTKFDETKLIVFKENTLKERKDEGVCFHCVWRPVIIHSFGIVVLMALLCYINKKPHKELK